MCEEHADLLPVYRIDVACVGVPGARKPGLPNRPLPVGCTGVLARVRTEFGRSHRGDVLGEEIEAINDVGKDPKDSDNEPVTDIILGGVGSALGEAVSGAYNSAQAGWGASAAFGAGAGLAQVGDDYCSENAC